MKKLLMIEKRQDIHIKKLQKLNCYKLYGSKESYILENSIRSISILFYESANWTVLWTFYFTKNFIAYLLFAAKSTNTTGTLINAFFIENILTVLFIKKSTQYAIQYLAARSAKKVPLSNAYCKLLQCGTANSSGKCYVCMPWNYFKMCQCYNILSKYFIKTQLQIFTIFHIIRRNAVSVDQSSTLVKSNKMLFFI